MKIVLYGDIGGKIDGDYLGQSIASLTEEDTIEVRINSIGGSVLEGYSIYSALLNSPAKVVVYVDYLAASIASLIMLAGDEINIAENGRVMLHSAFIPSKKINDKQKTALEAINKDLKMLLMKRTGNNEEWVNSVVSAKKDTWLNAEQAKEAGLVDNIIPIQKRIKNSIEEDISMEIEEFLEVYNKLIEGETEEIIYTNKKTYIQKPKIIEMDKIFNVLNLDYEKIAEDQRETVIVDKVQDILAEVDSIKAELNDLKVEKDGLEKTVASLEDTKSELEEVIAKYKEAEQLAFEAEVQAVIDAAVEAEKFTSEEDKEFYKENLINNFEKTKAVIDRIPGKELLIDVINKTEETKIEDEDIDDIPVV